ncbi:hypothetical protein Hypma_014072 [Hypsizygus marmoreus]|uniref:Uncharacterized protein n=1 Tax=Hypsizygus marmoreus TaxID=39966 RepID=A0A369K5Y9_HYPMA|nr:hypothetical protein Hypma_014072 [Hypsizygus marmoreus]
MKPIPFKLSQDQHESREPLTATHTNYSHGRHNSQSTRTSLQSSPSPTPPTATGFNAPTMKQRADILSNIQSSILECCEETKTVKKALLKADKRQQEATTHLDAILDRISALEDKQATDDKRIQTLEETVLALQATLENLPAAEVTDSSSVTKTNALSAAIREVFYNLMDIQANDQLPAPLPFGEYWTDGVIEGERILRPQFSLSWTNNSKWHKDFVKKFKESAHTLYPALPQPIIDKLTPAEIKKLAGQTYKNLKTRYKNEQKTGDEQKDDVKQARRNERKGIKAKARQDVRGFFEGLSSYNYNFMFQRGYQSSEYSDDTSAGEDDGTNETNEETTQPLRRAAYKRKKDAAWTTRPPNFRSQKVKDYLSEINKAVNEKIAGKNLEKKKGMKKQVPRIQGRLIPVTHLPKMGGIKVPTWAIDEDWLEQYGGENEGLWTEWSEGEDRDSDNDMDTHEDPDHDDCNTLDDHEDFYSDNDMPPLPNSDEDEDKLWEKNYTNRRYREETPYDSQLRY